MSLSASGRVVLLSFSASGVDVDVFASKAQLVESLLRFRSPVGAFGSDEHVRYLRDAANWANDGLEAVARFAAEDEAKAVEKA